MYICTSIYIHMHRCIYLYSPNSAWHYGVLAASFRYWIWYDGCNLCQIRNGVLGKCTADFCLVNGDSECRIYETDIDNSGH